MADARPAVLVWSSLFPNPAQPQAGVFVRERMFRVGAHLPITVISPQPWFPLQGLVRLFRPHFRPRMPRREQQMGVEVYRPRYFSFPGVFKGLDARLMALGALRAVRALRREGRVDLIDAHFGYPDGCAALRVAQRLGVPCTVTLRGTEARHALDSELRPQLSAALRSAARVFAVADSLRDVAISLGVQQASVRTVGNGVDSTKFRASDRVAQRQRLGLPQDATVLITVGGLVERKGFHRVIACMPELLRAFPALHYLVVGSPGPEGDYSERLKRQVAELGLGERVHFLGGMPPERLCDALSAADVFVLATRNEGWANVLLEAMACGLPVVATDVGGNAQVVCQREIGTIVPFDDHAALTSALSDALARQWDRGAIRRYAEANDWQKRVAVLVDEFRALHARGAGSSA
jgi:teichuronic acid biosynthesis glycosyltransferase TuaC